jgi:glycosyltransferase involved in cell wall biosynthesis
MKDNHPKLLIVTPEFPPEQWGGLARTVLKVAMHAMNLGIDTQVARLTVEPEKVILLDENRTTTTFEGIVTHNIIVGKDNIDPDQRDIWECPHNLSLQMMFQSLESLEATNKYDIFQSFFLYPVGYITGLLARKVKKPMVSCIVGNDVNRYFFSPEKVSVCKSGLDNSDFVVGLSKSLVDLADALSPISGKSRVIYNSVTIPDESWEPRPEPPSRIRIGCAGIFKYAKGLPYLFKAVAELSKKWNLHLALRGIIRHSEKDVFQEILTRTNIRRLVTMLEPAPHEEISGWLRSLDLFVLPSVTEGCPNIVMEAMAAGVPTIATEVGAVPDLIEDGVSGLLCPPGNSTALASQIERILENPDLANKLSKAGREKMKLFSAEREREEWRQVYRKFVEL